MQTFRCKGCYRTLLTHSQQARFPYVSARAKSQVKISASVCNSYFQNKVVPFVLMHLGQVNFFMSLVGGWGVGGHNIGKSADVVAVVVLLDPDKGKKTEGRTSGGMEGWRRCWRGAVGAGCAGRGRAGRDLWLRLGQSGWHSDLWRRQSSFLLLSAFVWFVPFILCKTTREKHLTES